MWRVGPLQVDSTWPFTRRLVKACVVDSGLLLFCCLFFLSAYCYLPNVFHAFLSAAICFWVCGWVSMWRPGLWYGAGIHVWILQQQTYCSLWHSDFSGEHSLVIQLTLVKHILLIGNLRIELEVNLCSWVWVTSPVICSLLLGCHFIGPCRYNSNHI
jgi:hypothetical protein